MEQFKSYLPILQNYLAEIAIQPALELKDASVNCNRGVCPDRKWKAYLCWKVKPNEEKVERTCQGILL